MVGYPIRRLTPTEQRKRADAFSGVYAFVMSMAEAFVLLAALAYAGRITQSGVLFAITSILLIATMLHIILQATAFAAAIIGGKNPDRIPSLKEDAVSLLIAVSIASVFLLSLNYTVHALIHVTNVINKTDGTVIAPVPELPPLPPM